MGRIVVAEYLTVDGVMEKPEEWVFPHWNVELAAFTREQLQAADAMLLGRATYDIFAASWPSRTSEDGHAERMNAIPKYVVSTTLQRADWNNSTVMRDGPVNAAQEAKRQYERDVLVWGSGALVRELLDTGAVDELRLMVFPVMLGGGTRLFAGAGAKCALSLADSRATSTGVVILSYRPAGSRRAG